MSSGNWGSTRGKFGYTPSATVIWTRLASSGNFGNRRLMQVPIPRCKLFLDSHGTLQALHLDPSGVTSITEVPRSGYGEWRL